MSEDLPTGRLGFSTRAIAAASAPPAVHQTPTAVPIYQSATFSADDAAELGDILADRVAGYAYARIDHPTGAAMAAAIATLEGAEAGHPFASGMAALHAALVASVSAGDHVVATRAIYGSTQTLLTRVLSRFGVAATFVDPTDPDGVAAAFTDRTRVLYLETISNPTIVVADLRRLIDIAHERGARVIVDNTFASPYLCRPAELGADLVAESCTKWLGGHSDVVAGCVSGRADAVSEVRRVAIDTGGTIEPFSAFLVLRGLQTLAVRMERHAASALALARSLEAHDAVERVYYPGLPSHPQYQVAQTLLRAGGGMLAFDLGTREAAARCIDALRLPPRTASLGSVHTLAVHPPSHTHRQLDEAALAAAGIPPGLVRVSVGLEDVEDLIADFGAALTATASAVHA
jgi:cystathionine beta-lyase/cystathionine gamma-synthase